MTDLQGLMLLTCLGLAGYYAFNAMRLKEAALQAVARRCKESGVQLLDSTVVLRRLRLARGSHGGLCFKREFEFEFTATGGERNRGWVRLLGNRIVSIELAPHRF